MGVRLCPSQETSGVECMSYLILNHPPSYSVQVAAMNDDLIGPYSTALDQLTEGNYIISYTVIVVYIISY